MSITDAISYSRISQDVANEKISDARDIGILDPNRTMLNLNSALTNKNNDKADYYKFRLTKNDKLGLTATLGDGNGIAGKVRIEVLNYAGRPIADSQAKSGNLKENYDQIIASNYDARKGNYYIRVTRDRSVSEKTNVVYSFQVRSNFNYREDYSTTEKPPSTTIQTSGALITSSAMSSQLNTLVKPLLGENNFFSITA